MSGLDKSGFEPGTKEWMDETFSPAMTEQTPAPELVRCTMGVGCDEAGVCYAEAHGQPEQCPKRHAAPSAPDGLVERAKSYEQAGDKAYDAGQFKDAADLYDEARGLLEQALAGDQS